LVIPLEQGSPQVGKIETIKEELLADPKEVIREDLKFLREYARRLLLEEDDALVAIEDFKDILMQEFLAVGKSLKLTERDMMVLLFRGILDKCCGAL
jgi:hypothetical protein